MGNYLFRVFNSLLGSELVPAFVRGKLMRAAGFKVSNTCTIWAGCSIRSKKIAIGTNVFINVGFFFDGDDYCSVGNNVRIGQFVRIITATHNIGPSSQRGMVEVITQPVRIEDGSWIGAGVTIMPGVTIGPGCVIATNSVVTESTKADGLYAGTPAKRVRDLSPSGSRVREGEALSSTGSAAVLR
jgi:maltose O-acetyltransferase